MRMCQSHWDALRSAIEQRGIGHLIARTGEECAANVRREIEGESTIIDFDPLMSANNALWSLSMNVIGLDMMTTDEQGNHRCPVCELQKFDYVAAAAEGALHHARATGLIESADGQPNDADSD